MDLNLSGQTAVIVGAARGIGQAIAQGLAAEKANLAMIDLLPDIAATAQQLQERYSVQTLSFPANVTDYQAMCDTAQKIRAAWQRIDHVIFAAGVSFGKIRFSVLEPTAWRLGAGCWRCERSVGDERRPCFCTGPGGSSPPAPCCLSHRLPGKWARRPIPPTVRRRRPSLTLLNVLPKIFAPYHVPVNALCPGMVKTTLNRSIWEAWHRLQPPDKQLTFEQWAEDKIRRLVPLGRWQAPEEIAAMVVFLTSPQASSVTGQTINVDGGWVMHW